MADVPLFVIGVALLFLAAFFWFTEAKKKREHQKWCASRVTTEGVVSRIALRGHYSKNAPTSDEKKWSVPIVRFRASDGVEYEIDAANVRRRVGIAVMVAYDPASPSSGLPVAYTPKVGCSIVLAVIGIVLIVKGING